MVNVGSIMLPCGHEYENAVCHKTQDLSLIRCMTKVTKIIPSCGHSKQMSCFKDAVRGICKKICSEPLPCGHDCSSTCGNCTKASATHGNWPSEQLIVKNAHTRCAKTCGRHLSCDHICKETCHTGKHCLPCSEKCSLMICKHGRCEHKCGDKNACHICIEPCQIQICPHREACPLPCGAACAIWPCDKRCDKKLPCGHQCPTVCGEECPPVTLCQICGSNEIKDQQVDLIMLQEYKDVDLDETAVIVLECGHIFTYETLDGQVGMNDFYSANGSDSYENAELKLPEDMKTSVPVCSKCRQPITGVKRYSRIIKQSILDRAEAKFLSLNQERLNALTSWREPDLPEDFVKSLLDARSQLQNEDVYIGQLQLKKLGIPITHHAKLKLLLNPLFAKIQDCRDYINNSVKSPQCLVYDATVSMLTRQLD